LPPRTHHSLVRSARRAALICAWLVAAIGAATLLGWAAGLRGLSRIDPDALTLRPNTALALVLVGLGAAAHVRPPRRAWRLPLRAGVLLAGLMVACSGLEWIVHADLLVDDLLRPLTGLGETAGRTGPLSSGGLLALCAALEADRHRRIGGRIVNALAGGAVLAGLAGIVGYVSALDEVTRPTGALRIALGSAIGLVLGGVSVLLARPERGDLRLLVSRGPGGVVARRLLPVVVVVPMLLNPLRFVATDTGLLSERAGDWVYSFLVLAIFGTLVTVLARALDTAEQRRRASEERLRASEALARSVTESAHDAIVVGDERGWITLFNPGAERLFGWAAAEVLGRPVTLLMPERYRAGHRMGLARLTAGQEPSLSGQALELHGLTKAGREFDLEISLAVDRVDERLRITAIMRDITPRKVVEQLNRRESELMTRVAAAQSRIGAGTGELDDTMGRVAAEACEIVEADGAVVELPDGDDMVYRAVVGAAASSRDLRVPIDGSLAGLALRTSKTYNCADSETDDRVDREACRRAGLRSMVCVPLRHDGLAVGVLKVFTATARVFDDRDERVLELLAALAAGAVHRARVERRLAAHHAAGDALAGARSLEAGLAGALRGIGEQLGWELGAVWLAEARDGALECVETWHEPALPVAPYLELCGAPEPAAAGGLLATVRRTSSPLWLEQLGSAGGASADPRRAAAATACGLRTLVGVPIVSRGETLGVVELGARAAHTHDAETLELLAGIATQIGLFVQRRRAEERMSMHAANLAAVAEFSQELSRTNEPRTARRTIVSALRTLTRTDSVTLLEPDGEGHLVVTAQSGDVFAEQTTVALDEDQAISVRVFTSGRGRFIDAATLAGSGHDLHGIRSAQLEPLVRDGKVVGVLAVAARETRSADHLGLGPLMRLLASEAAGALALADLLLALEARARTDELTGVANRRGWDEELPRELARAARSGAPVTVAIIDLDHFKKYNDTHGHQAGDRLLRAAAAAWSARLRTTDLIARYGGEEFAVVLPGCDADAAGLVADALRRSVPEDATCSIGVATWEADESAEALVARADAALYRAKAAGRDRVVTAA